MPKTRKDRQTDVKQLVGILEEFGEAEVMAAVTALGIAPPTPVPLVTTPLTVEGLLPLLLLLASQDFVSWKIAKEDPANAANWLVSLEARHALLKDQANVTVSIRTAVIATLSVKTKGDAGIVKDTFSARKGALLLLQAGGTQVSSFAARP